MTVTSPSRTPHTPTPAPGAAPSRRAVFRPRILGAVLAAATLLLARPAAAAAPTIDSGDTAIDYQENSTAVVETYTATDADGDTITWDVTGTDSALFAISSSGELTFNSPPDYEDPQDDGVNNTYAVTVEATAGGDTVTVDVTVTVTDVNEAPTITGDTAPDYPENGTTVVETYTATDPEGDPITSWDVTGTDSALFAISSSGELTFNSPPDYEDPQDDGANNTYAVTVEATAIGGTSTEDVTVTVTDVNEAPTITGETALGYLENGTAVLETYTASDPEDDAIAWSVTGTDSALFAISSSGELTFNSPPDYENPQDDGTDNTYAVTVNAADGAFTVTANVTVTVTDVNEAPTITGDTAPDYAENGTAVVETYTVSDPEGDTITLSVTGTDSALFVLSATGALAFRTPPDYENPQDDGADNTYAVTVNAATTVGTSTEDVTVTVTDVNEAPTIDAGDTEIDYPENGTAVVETYTATDPEDDAITWSVTGTDSALFAISSSGELTFTSPPDFENPLDDGTDNTYAVTVNAADGAFTVTANVTVTVTDVNEPPTIAGDTAPEYPENGTTVVATYTARDQEGDAITLSVTGTDSALFAISSSGELTFTSPPDYETPLDDGADNTYAVTVNAADGENTATANVTVTVTDVNEPPTITGETAPEYPENSTAVIAIYTARDPENEPITWAVTGPDSGRFALSPAGELTFNSPPDYENPQDVAQDNAYAVTVEVAVGTHTATRAVTVTVTDVNEAPTIDAGPTATTYAENDTAVVATFTATDPEGETVRWQLSGEDRGRFALSPTGVLTFRNPPDYDAPQDTGQDNTYTVTVGVVDPGGLTHTQALTVSVLGVEEAPVLTGPTATTYAENGTTAVATYTATDPEGEPITWDVEGLDGSLFAIDTLTGALTFQLPPDFEAPQDTDQDNVYEITMAVTAGADTVRQDLTVTVIDENEAPTIDAGPTAFAYAENDTVVVATFTATDPEGDDIMWRVEGPDGARFALSASGELTFRRPPDFEAPQDADQDNTYEIAVVAADANQSSERAVTVTVGGVDEAPVITGPQATRVVFSTTRVVGTYTATDPEGAPAVLGVAGPDLAFFTLAESGALTFQAPPAGGAPQDANQDNVYEVTVVARDAGPEGMLAVAVRVTPPPPPPGTPARAGTPPATDTARPQVTLQAAVATHRGTPFGLTIRFSEPVSGFRLGAIAVQNGTAAQFTPQSPQTYTVTITPAPAAAAVQIAVGANGAQDGAGNGNRPATLVVEAAAALVGYFESPAADTAVAGIDLIRGWVFAPAADEEITALVLYIDGQPAATIPCCSARLDVAAAYPALPATTTTLSGWGVTYNWGELPAGPHTLRVVATSSQGRQWESARRQVEVLKPGDVAFADRVSLATATARLEDEELELREVVLRDQASQQEQRLTLRYAWQTAAQGLRLVETRPAAAAAAPGAASLLARLRAGLTRWGRGWLSPAAATAATGLTAVYEAPADGSVVAGVGLVRGWAFSDLTPAEPRVALLIDGAEQGPVPCCSARPDVAAAYPGVAGALASGWGLVFNYGDLKPGPHTLGVRLTAQTAGGAPLEETLTHTVTVVRLGGYAFVDEFDLRAATVRLEDEVVVLSGVVVRDKATQATQVVEVRLRWTAATQGLRIVGSQVQP